MNEEISMQNTQPIPDEENDDSVEENNTTSQGLGLQIGFLCIAALITIVLVPCVWMLLVKIQNPGVGLEGLVPFTQAFFTGIICFPIIYNIINIFYFGFVLKQPITIEYFPLPKIITIVIVLLYVSLFVLCYGPNLVILLIGKLFAR